MGDHVEEQTLTVRIHLRAEFAPEYEGEDDGFAWLQRWKQRVYPQVVKAVFDSLRADETYEVVPASRGGSPEDTLEIDVRRRKVPA